MFLTKKIHNGLTLGLKTPAFNVFNGKLRKEEYIFFWNDKKIRKAKLK